MSFGNDPLPANLIPRVTLRKVRRESQADPHCVKLMLFRGKGERVCGWYIGPVSIGAEGVEMPYLPQSEDAIASVAFVRALTAANFARTSVCVVDPDDLWSHVWRD